MAGEFFRRMLLLVAGEAKHGLARAVGTTNAGVQEFTQAAKGRRLGHELLGGRCRVRCRGRRSGGARLKGRRTHRLSAVGGFRRRSSSRRRGNGDWHRLRWKPRCWRASRLRARGPRWRARRRTVLVREQLGVGAVVLKGHVPRWCPTVQQRHDRESQRDSACARARKNGHSVQNRLAEHIAVRRAVPLITQRAMLRYS